MSIESGGAQLTVGQPSQPFELCSPMCGHFDRKRELKRCTWPGVGGGPQATAVRFDNRPTDGQSHAGALRFGGKERLEDLFRLFLVLSHPRIDDRDQNLTILVLLRPDRKFSWSAYTLHGFDAVEHHVHQNL